MNPLNRRGMVIKVCGIKSPAGAIAISELSPNLMGFIFHKPSPRDITPHAAQFNFSAIPQSIGKVAVFVDKPYDYIIGIVRRFGFSYVQLHGKEPISLCEKLRRDVKVIKAFGMESTFPVDVKQYANVADLFLFDTHSAAHGGTGRKFNHELLEDYTLEVPFLLAGGIAPSDADLVKRINHPAFAGVDLNSRFETSAGEKSVALLHQFFKSIQHES